MTRSLWAVVLLVAIVLVGIVATVMLSLWRCRRQGEKHPPKTKSPSKIKAE